MLSCCYCNKSIKGEVKHGLHIDCFTKYFSLNSPMQNFQNLALKQVSASLDSGIIKTNTSFFHGMFKKYSAEIEGEQYILKVAQDGYPELPKVEYISNVIGKILGLNIPDFYFIKFQNVQDTFVSKNFMTKKSGANLIHIYHFFKDGEKHSCENILRVIQEKCGKLSDIREFVKMCLFDSLIGNHDRHGRNIGIIQTGPSSYILSPTYDNPSYIGIEEDYLLEADHNPKGCIITKMSDEPTIKDYIIELRNAGYGDLTDEFINKIKIKWNEIIQVIEKSQISMKRKKAFIKILEKRKSEMG